MAKFKVSQQADYVMGHLRYGHREGIVKADSLEDAKKIIEGEGRTDCLNFVLDGYRCDDVSYGSNPFEYEEVEDE